MDPVQREAIQSDIIKRSHISSDAIKKNTPLPHSQEKASVDVVARDALDKESHVAERPKHEWGEVIVLIGTSTAGKSSIISELTKQKPGMVEYGLDLAYTNIPMAFLNTNHAEEMDFLRQVIEPRAEDIKDPGRIVDYIARGKKPDYKADVSSEERNRCTEMIKKLNESLVKAVPGDDIIHLMMDQVMIDSKRGSPVVFDVLHVDQVAKHILIKEHPSIKIALVYVPFQDLAVRVIGRNDQAVKERDFNNARPGLFPLEQFTSIFRPKRDDKEEVVQKLTLKEVKLALDTVHESGEAFLEKHDPKEFVRLNRLQEEIDARGKILKELGFEEGDAPDKVVELTPQYKGYHILINNAQTDKPKTEALQTAVGQILFKNG